MVYPWPVLCCLVVGVGFSGLQGAAKVSMLMVGQQAIMDAYLCLLHLTAGIVVGECLTFLNHLRYLLCAVQYTYLLSTGSCSEGLSSAQEQALIPRCSYYCSLLYLWPHASGLPPAVMCCAVLCALSPPLCSSESLFNAFATAAFFKFVIFSIFEMRYLLAIWKARAPPAQQTLGTPCAGSSRCSTPDSVRPLSPSFIVARLSSLCTTPD